MKEEFVQNVLVVKIVSDRVMSLKTETEGVIFNISGYAPWAGCDLEEREKKRNSGMRWMTCWRASPRDERVVKE